MALELEPGPDAVTALVADDAEVGCQRSRPEHILQRRLLDEAVVIFLVERVGDERAYFDVVEAVGYRPVDQHIAGQHRRPCLADRGADPATLGDRAGGEGQVAVANRHEKAPVYFKRPLR